jgi:hypothetical protein
VTEWEAADHRYNLEKSDRVRQAAEDLFKPTRRPLPAELPTPVSNAVASVAQQPKRKPRIFTIPPRALLSEQVEIPGDPKPTRRKAATKSETGSVPASQVGRVRALTSYGMTPAQVAKLYGVRLGEIERIIRGTV